MSGRRGAATLKMRSTRCQCFVADKKTAELECPGQTSRNECIRGTAEVEQFKKHKVRGKVEMVWTGTEEGQWIYWVKDVKYGCKRKMGFMDEVKKDRLV